MKIIKKYKYIIVIFFITVILLLKLFVLPRNFGHDTGFHIANIIQLSKTISLKQIFGTKLLTFDSNIYGYGTYYFYPKLPHLLASYLYLIFKNVYTSMNIIYFITTFFSGLSMFLLSKKIFNNKKIALISSIIYLTIPYHISEIYIRDAYAENFMFLVLPLIFLGLYHLKDDNYQKFYLFFILGYVIGIYSHLVSMLFYTILIGIFILYYRKQFLKKDKLKALIISTLIVTGISLPFLTTVIEYKLSNIYTVFLSQKFANRDSVLQNVTPLTAFFNQTLRFDKLQLYFNYTTIILFTITLIQLIFIKTKERKKLIPILILILILINLTSSNIIWENMPQLFLTIQFPWRLLVLLSMLVSLCAPICLIHKIKINKSSEQIVFCLIIILILIEGINNIVYYGDQVFSESWILTQNVSMGHQQEYLPLKTNEHLISGYWNTPYVEIREDGIISTNKNAKIEILENDFPNLTFKIENIDKTTLELPRVYYLGYELTDENGAKIELSPSQYGFLKAEIKKEGKYKLTHKTTTVEKITNIIGVLTLILCIIFYLKRYKNEK